MLNQKKVGILALTLVTLTLAACNAGQAPAATTAPTARTTTTAQSGTTRAAQTPCRCPSHPRVAYAGGGLADHSHLGRTVAGCAGHGRCRCRHGR